MHKCCVCNQKKKVMYTTTDQNSKIYCSTSCYDKDLNEVYIEGKRSGRKDFNEKEDYMKRKKKDVFELCDNERDPITFDLISELDADNKYALKLSNGRYHCFKLDTLVAWLKESSSNPINNELLSESVIKDILDKYTRLVMKNKREKEQNDSNEKILMQFNQKKLSLENVMNNYYTQEIRSKLPPYHPGQGFVRKIEFHFRLNMSVFNNSFYNPNDETEDIVLMLYPDVYIGVVRYLFALLLNVVPQYISFYKDGKKFLNHQTFRTLGFINIYTPKNKGRNVKVPKIEVVYEEDDSERTEEYLEEFEKFKMMLPKNFYDNDNSY